MAFGGSAFGSSNPFGASSAFGSSAPPFGSSAPPFGASTSAFGSSAPAFASAFGASSSAFAAPPSAFGAASTPFPSSQTPFAPSSQPFAQPSTPFGAAPASTPFGQPPTPFAPAPSTSAPAFGAAPASTPFAPASTPFGASAQPFGSASGPFGGSAAPFGVANTPFGGAAGATAGAPTPTFPSSAPAPTPFGAAPVASAPFAPPATTGDPPSTRNPRWQISALTDNSNSNEPGKYLCLTAMDVYAPFSLEELRLSDYQRNDRGGPEPTTAGVNPGATTTTPFAQPASTPFAQQASTPFAQPASTPSLFSSNPASSPFASSFAQPSSAPSLFPASNPTSAPPLFPTSSPASAPSLFSSAPSAFPSTTPSLFPAAQPAPAPSLLAPSQPSTTPSLFPSVSGSSLLSGSGPSLFASNPSAAGGGGGLFQSTGSSLFPATGSSLFPTSGSSLFPSSTPTIMPTSTGASLFPTQPGLPNTQQLPSASAPLEASLTANPFGTSHLFMQSTAPATSVPTTNPIPAPNGTQAATLSVVVSSARRARGAEAIARQTAMGRRAGGHGWFSASPMRPWGRESSLFDVASALRPGPPTIGGPGSSTYVAPWRTEEQTKRAANIKKLVIEPIPDDPIFKAAAAFASHPVRRGTPGQSDPASSAAVVVHGDANAGADEQELGGERRIGDVAPRRSAFEIGRGNSGRPLSTVHVSAANINGRDDTGLERGGSVHPTPATGNMEGVSDGVPSQGQHAVDLTTDPRQLEATSPRYVPYRESLEAPLGTSNAPDLEPMPTRSHAPVTNNPNLYTRPPLQELRAMSEEELSRVSDFAVGIEDIGEVVWDDETDVRDVMLDDVVVIVPREICVYPDDTIMPPIGQKLNKPARVQLHGIWKMDKKTRRAVKDTSAAAAIVRRLKVHCEREGLVFLGYDVRSGTWSFRAEHF